MRLLLITLCLLCACSSHQKPVKQDTTTFYFIRHAETVDSKEKDKILSSEGVKRANKWVEILNDVDFDVVYSTDYKRTQSTAEPVARKMELEIVSYHPKDVNLTDLKEKHKGQNILIVGHSNTTPTLVNSLLGEELYAQIEHSDHDNLYTVTISKGNEVTVSLISTDE